MQKATTCSPENTDFRQHFQNYFEFLLGAERAKLQQTITCNQEISNQKLQEEIDQRIAYLKGAVRMGILLCAIPSEQARLKYQILESEREMLLDSCSRRRPLP